MNKISGLMALALLGIQGELQAAWFRVYDDANLSYYVDPNTARKTGSRVQLLDLIDYKHIKLIAGQHPYLSMQTQSEFDCEHRTTRWLNASFHRGPMGSGALIQMATNVDPDEQWKPITQDSLGQVRWQFACEQLRWQTQSKNHTPKIPKPNKMVAPAISMGKWHTL